MGEDRITQDEMIALFGEEMPIAAVNLMFQAPDDWTVSQVRAELRRIAAASPAPSLPEDVERAVERLKLRSYAAEQECRADDAAVMTDADALIQSLSSQIADRDRLAAENERLREALRAARSQFTVEYGEPFDVTAIFHEEQALWTVVRIFDHALASLEERG